ncbi:MAG: YraN family protein [Clostridiales bacterium]|nr:YraN family protein [Clostridiales bacterium]
MSRNQSIGKASEEFVSDFLVRRGAVILARNYAVHNVGELDIICRYKARVLVIEVKSRDFRTRYGSPEEAVTALKQNKILRTTAHFCKENHIPLESVSYFVAGVIHDVNGNVEDVRFTSFF